MWTFPSFLAPFVRLFSRLGACGLAGYIVGFWAGGLLTLLSLSHGGAVSPTAVELLALIVLLSLFCWGVLLFINVVFLRYRPGSVWAHALVFATLICLLTVLVVETLGNYTLGIVVGILVGLFVGFVFCSLVRRLLG
ncbi:MAG: hypothetical protein Tsb0032_10280 [Kiloniellaceae bacterium]